MTHHPTNSYNGITPTKVMKLYSRSIKCNICKPHLHFNMFLCYLVLHYILMFHNYAQRAFI
jgi:hypothetical protein